MSTTSRTCFIANTYFLGALGTHASFPCVLFGLVLYSYHSWTLNIYRFNLNYLFKFQECMCCRCLRDVFSLRESWIENTNLEEVSSAGALLVESFLRALNHADVFPENQGQFGTGGLQTNTPYLQVPPAPSRNTVGLTEAAGEESNRRGTSVVTSHSAAHFAVTSSAPSRQPETNRNSVMQQHYSQWLQTVVVFCPVLFLRKPWPPNDGEISEKQASPQSASDKATFPSPFTAIKTRFSDCTTTFALA